MPSRESARPVPGGRKSRNVFTPGSRSKISNLMITELFYFYILDMSRGFLCIRRFRRIHLSVFRYKLTKNSFAGAKSFRRFWESGPWHYRSLCSCPSQCFLVRPACSLVHSTFIPRVSPFLLYQWCSLTLTWGQPRSQGLFPGLGAGAGKGPGIRWSRAHLTSKVCIIKTPNSRWRRNCLCWVGLDRF